MIEPEFMKIKAKYFLEDIQKLYHISEKMAQNSYVYCKIKRGMYGLKQAEILAWDQLVQHMEP